MSDNKAIEIAKDVAKRNFETTIEWLNEAQRKVEDLTAERDAMFKVLKALLNEAEGYLKERDELRRDVERLEAENDKLHYQMAERVVMERRCKAKRNDIRENGLG